MVSYMIFLLFATTAFSAVIPNVPVKRDVTDILNTLDNDVTTTISTLNDLDSNNKQSVDTFQENIANIASTAVSSINDILNGLETNSSTAIIEALQLNSDLANLGADITNNAGEIIAGGIACATKDSVKTLSDFTLTLGSPVIVNSNDPLGTSDYFLSTIGELGTAIGALNCANQ